MSNKRAKQELLDLLEERDRRKREARTKFIPNEGQLPVIKSPALTKLVLSGNGAGKTALGVNMALWAATGYNPVTNQNYYVPARVIVVLDKPEKVDNVWLPEIKKWFTLKPDQLHKKGKPYISQITFENGSEILFMFHEAEPMTFESIEASWFIFDEPPLRHIWVALRRAGRSKLTEARYIIIGTPITGSWLRTEIYEPWSKGELEEVECFRFGTSVNEANLADGYISRFSRFLTDKEKQMRLEGAFFDLDGLALAAIWRRDKHIVAPFAWNPQWPVVIAIDPHTRKKHHALMVGITPEGYYFALKEFSQKVLPSGFARELASWAAGYRVLDVIVDNLGSSELTGGMGALSFIQVINNTWREMGVKLRGRPTTFDEKSDEAWIQHIQEVLYIPEKPNNMGETVPQLRVFSDCRGLIVDIESASWYKIKNSEDLKPKIDISNRDFLSCLKYALATQPRFITKKERVIKSARSPWSGAAGERGNGKRRVELTEDEDW